MDVSILYIIFGVIGILFSFGITVLVIVLPYMERKDDKKALAAKEAAEREERANREKMVKTMIDTVVDYDFARDATAGKETTSYKEFIDKAKERAAATA